MKLQRQISRIMGKRKYEKWVVVVPKSCIDKLGWVDGVNLMAEVQGQLLIIRQEIEEMEKMAENTYEAFKESVEKGLKGEKDGLTWLQLMEKMKMNQKRPFNQWVRQLEKDIGLIREKKGGKTYWRLP